MFLLGKDNVSITYFINSGNTYSISSSLFSLLGSYFGSSPGYNMLCIVSLSITNYFVLIAILYNSSIKIIVKIKIKNRK